MIFIFFKEFFFFRLQNISNNSNDIPKFLIVTITKIELYKSTIGVYRINGDAAKVQKLR